MRKYSIRTIVLTIVLLLALAGAALAISRQLGVLDFLAAGRELSEEVTGAVQTELSQEGGGLPGATVRIRDAVSDGRTLFLAVEVRTKDPQAAILAMTDAINWKDPEERAAFMTSREPETQPLYDQIADGQPLIYVGENLDIKVARAEDGEPLTLEVGSSWRYESTDTLVIHQTMDLMAMDDPRDELLLEITAYELLGIRTIGFKEWMAKNEAGEVTSFMEFDESIPSEFTARVKAGTMPVQRTVAEAPFTFGDIHFREFVLETTPLAAYVTTDRSVRRQEEPNNGWFFELYDSEDRLYENMAKIVRDFAPIEIDEDGYARGTQTFTNPGGAESPESITIRAKTYLTDPIDMPEDVTITLVSD